MYFDVSVTLLSSRHFFASSTFIASSPSRPMKLIVDPLMFADGCAEIGAEAAGVAVAAAVAAAEALAEAADGAADADEDAPLGAVVAAPVPHAARNALLAVATTMPLDSRRKPRRPIGACIFAQR